mgnify:FL=1
MFPAMRRKDRELSREDAERILREGEYGTLSLNRSEGYPHAVPMSYAYEDGVIWLHCARAGTKLDVLRADPRASFSVVGPTEVLPEQFSTNYESTLCYGDISEVAGSEAEQGLMALVAKYSPGFIAEGGAYIERAKAGTCVLKLVIRHMTGKART